MHDIIMTLILKMAEVKILVLLINSFCKINSLKAYRKCQSGWKRDRKGWMEC